ncbi:winged helix-turn-helix domain-containing protein [Microbulbifer variabilis]|uniref:winged helix-turn-helix domain-containing protein n=1 Tax=Microbulbifer variabilis TaxID=266805 RepID=UPI001CFD4F58|nr:winged helix-turn-helix domain-containing protein [Microbulbifer variabilis]
MTSPRYISLGEWTLDLELGLLQSQDIKKRLDYMPLQLLKELIKHRGEIVSKNHLLSTVWANKVVGEEVLTVAVSQIRKALKDNAKQPEYIKTISGQGYRLICPVKEKVLPGESRRVFEILTIRGRNFIGAIVILISFTIILTFVTSLDSAQGALSAQQIDDFQRGRYLLTLDDRTKWLQAKSTFERIIIEENTFAPAYLALIESKLLLGESNNKELFESLDGLYELADKALALSPDSVKAHLLKARLAFHIAWDFELAEKHYKEALAIAPNYGSTHFAYSQFLLAKRDFSGALRHVSHYIDTNPSAYSKPMVAWIYNMSGQYTKAYEELKKIEQIAPDSLEYLVSAQSILENQGLESESFQFLKSILSANGYHEQDMDLIDSAFAQGGLTSVYQWLLDVKGEPLQIGQYQPPIAFARFAASAGKPELALTYLQQAVDSRQFEILWLNADPKYQTLRSFPAYKDLIRKIGIP